MSFSKKYYSSNKSSAVWKRNVNTSDTNRRPGCNNKNKIHLISQSSDYSSLHDNQNTLKTSFEVNRPKTNKNQWNQIKSIAKRSTIASRIELKKSVADQFLVHSQKKGTKSRNSSKSGPNRPLSRIVDTQGNITRTFKQDKQFQSLNPHIPRDMNIMKKKVFKMYQKQMKYMDAFLTLNQAQIVPSKLNNSKNKSSSLYAGNGSLMEMNRISERQQYSQTINTNRNTSILKDKVKQKQGLEPNRKKLSHQQTEMTKILKKDTGKALEILRQSKPIQISLGRSKGLSHQAYQKPKSLTINQSKGVSTLKDNQEGSLLKGLLGEYSNYERLSKHELIQKLISLQYLAQNIFKKNKHLEQKMKQQSRQLQHNQVLSRSELPSSHQSPLKRFQTVNTQGNLVQDVQVIKFDFRRQKSEHCQQNALQEYSSPIESFDKPRNNKVQDLNKPSNNVYEDKNIFIINNDDGYFNEFLESQKGKQNQNDLHINRLQQLQPQRFRQQQNQ